MNYTEFTLLCSVVVKGFTPVPECSMRPLQTVLDIQRRDSVNTFIRPVFKYEFIIVLYNINESLRSLWCDIDLAGEHVVVCVCVCVCVRVSNPLLPPSAQLPITGNSGVRPGFMG